MKKVGMVLEGGAMRGIYTMGVLDTLFENKIEVDGIIGVSAGALFGANYFSNQVGRALRYTKKYYNDKRYISKKSLFLTGNIVNKNFAFYKVTKELDPFDNDAFIKANKDYYAVATNVCTGEAEYLKITDVYKQLEAFRATSAMPMVSRIVKIDGKKYLDGGISDSIPIDKCISLGYEKIIVVLTQPLDYRKKPVDKDKMKFARFKYRKYKKLLNTMENRYKEYNSTLVRIIDMENKKEIFVIRPSKRIKINLVPKNDLEIDNTYQLGVSDCKKILKDLKKYLKS